MINNRGPRMEPWGTPVVICMVCDDDDDDTESLKHNTVHTVCIYVSDEHIN